MSNLSSFFTTGARGVLKFLRKPGLTYKGDWVQVFPNTVLDSWHVGEFSTASYLLTVEHNSNKKEVMHINVVARPDQASYNVYGRTSIDDELITLDASVTNSIFSLKASPTDPVFLGVKVTILAFYGETINPLSPPVAVSTGPGFTAGTGGNTEGGGTGSTYILPTAGVGSNGTLGGVRVDGTSITISSGVISSTSAPVSRSTVSTTVNLAGGANTTATVTMAKSYTLYSIQTSAPAWVTLYVSSASQTADASREITTDPLPGSGVVAEVITTGNQTVLMSPAVAGYNFETPTTTNAYLKIYNTSGSVSAITVTLTYLTNLGSSNGSSGTTSNSFSTIEVAGQASVIAGTSTSPLTLVAGSNMTITTNATTDTITFASTDTAYSLPTASTTVLGGVRVDGSTLAFNGSGQLYYTGAGVGGYTLPTATTNQLGGVKVDGTSVTINGSGVITANYTNYILPTASTTVLGGVKVDGTSVTINGSGVIAATYSLPTASTTVLGGVKVDGTTVTINGSGVITSNYTTYTLPTASTMVLGGVKVDGTSVTIDGSGVISSSATSIPTYPAVTRLDVTNSGASAYLFNNQYSGNNPTIYAISGTTIAFNLNVVGHPFLIRTAGGVNYDTGLIHVSTTGTVLTGSAAQGQQTGTLYWQIPAGTTGNYQYICALHGSMVGVIAIQSNTSPTFTGTVTLQQSVEKFTSPAISTNAVTLNFTNGAIFALSGNGANITANFTNIPGTAGQTISTTLVITQGSTAYIPNVVTINGGGNITPKWQGSSAPTGNANKTDIVNFTFICTSTNTWTTIGSLSTYG